MEGIQDKPGEGSPPSSSSRTRILFGDPKVQPQVGDEYQVKLPPLMTKDEYLQRMENPFHFGLPIPVTLVVDQCESINKKPANPDAAVHIPGLVDSESSEENHIFVNNEDANGKIETLGHAFEQGEEIAGDIMEIDLGSLKEKTRSFDCGPHGYVPMPGLFGGETWKDIERDGFLLGLYIFEKNLYLVKKFVGKEMGEILSYYYGKFYKSSEYNKWLEYWKKREERSRSFGEKIFKSWRQRELLSRLSSHVSEECKARLIEASRIGEGKTSPIKYAFALKEIVGLKLLVQEIAFGKGKRDLMALRVDHAQTNPPFPSRSEITCGNSGSTLTVDEIVKFITGDIRLSKSRSNDLFWDAVWPRLVDKGWRAEETRSYISLSSKPSWVYLLPGVKKFSKRKLIKGTHYFDSVADVLNKVALEPKLLEVEHNTAELSICRDEAGSGAAPQAEQGMDGSSSSKRHSYLKPRVFQGQLKFTIMDTSLVCGKEMEKVIELRTLPADPITISTPPAVSEGVEEHTLQESQNVVQESDFIHVMEDVVEIFEASMDSNNHSPNGPDLMMSKSGEHEDQKQLGMPVEVKFHRSVQSPQPNEVGPTTNKQTLTPCDNKGGSKSNDGSKDICTTDDDTAEIENNATQAEAFTKPLSENSSECSPVDKSQETWIDLNLPRTPPELSETSQQPPSGTVLINGQRQSTRNRPLTTKALEAYACGYLSPKKKRKGGESSKQPPRRVRVKTEAV